MPANPLANTLMAYGGQPPSVQQFAAVNRMPMMPTPNVRMGYNQLGQPITEYGGPTGAAWDYSGPELTARAHSDFLNNLVQGYNAATNRFGAQGNYQNQRMQLLGTNRLPGQLATGAAAAEAGLRGAAANERQATVQEQQLAMLNDPNSRLLALINQVLPGVVASGGDIGETIRTLQSSLGPMLGSQQAAGQPSLQDMVNQISGREPNLVNGVTNPFAGFARVPGVAPSNILAGILPNSQTGAAPSDASIMQWITNLPAMVQNQANDQFVRQNWGRIRGMLAERFGTPGSFNHTIYVPDNAYSTMPTRDPNWSPAAQEVFGALRLPYSLAARAAGAYTDDNRARSLIRQLDAAHLTPQEQFRIANELTTTRWYQTMGPRAAGMQRQAQGLSQTPQNVNPYLFPQQWLSQGQ
jgi:hypothetical protein